MTQTGDAGQRGGLTFGILGPPRAVLNGQEVHLGGPRQRAVIALLLLARGPREQRGPA